MGYPTVGIVLNEVSTESFQRMQAMKSEQDEYIKHTTPINIPGGDELVPHHLYHADEEHNILCDYSLFETTLRSELDIYNKWEASTVIEDISIDTTLLQLRAYSYKRGDHYRNYGNIYIERFNIATAEWVTERSESVDNLLEDEIRYRIRVDGNNSDYRLRLEWNSSRDLLKGILTAKISGEPYH